MVKILFSDKPAFGSHFSLSTSPPPSLTQAGLPQSKPSPWPTLSGCWRMKDTLRQLAVKFNFSNTFQKITNEFIACAIDCYPFITSLGEFMKWISRSKTVNRNDTFVLDKGEVTRWRMRMINLKVAGTR